MKGSRVKPTGSAGICYECRTRLELRKVGGGWRAYCPKCEEKETDEHTEVDN